MKVLVCDHIHPEGTQVLRAAGFQVDEKPQIVRQELDQVVSDYDILVVRGRTKIDARIIRTAENLRIIGRAGVGLDNIDTQTAMQAGITVLNTPAAPSVSVAELTIALMLSLLRKIPLADREMKSGRWIKSQLMGEELHSKRVGVIGRAGRIGNEVARILTVGFQAEVLGYDVIPPRGVPGLSFELANSVEDLLQRSDIVTAHVPYTKETHHLLNEQRLKMMKRGSYLINTSRGDIVDGTALLSLLRSGHLAGAGLDVYHIEPPADEWEKALVGLPEGVTVTTCHIGAQTLEAQRRESVELANRIILESSKMLH